ncbi:MAG: hypothetical protein ACR2O8_12520 [Rhizobiaceae bacterium]
MRSANMNIRDFAHVGALATLLVCANVAHLGAANLIEPVAESEPTQFNGNALTVAPTPPTNALTVFAGRLASGSLENLIMPNQPTKFENVNFVGAAYSKEFWRNDYISLEVEAGVGQLIGKRNNSTQVWGAGYLRYHAFPWNHIVRTTIAASIGVNYQFRDTAFEDNVSNTGKSTKLLHYFSPEITLAHPDWESVELVTRIHHRSAVYGLFDCDGCGSNVLTFGVRNRF